jgi:uncharacterized RDD family membrane protein YckC
MVDSLVNGTVTLFAIGVGAALNNVPVAGLTTALDNRVFGAVALTLAAIPLNALMIGFTGFSLGKWLFGVRVLQLDSQPMGFGVALYREFAVWLRGLGLGLPIVILFTCWSGFKALQKTGRATWDSELGLKVVHRPRGTRQFLGASLGFIAWFVFIVGLSALGAD